MWGDLPVSDAPIAGLAFHTAYTGGGPCNIATSGSKSTVAAMTVERSTQITTTVTPISTATYTVQGG